MPGARGPRALSRVVVVPQPGPVPKTPPPVEEPRVQEETPKLALVIPNRAPWTARGMHGDLGGTLLLTLPLTQP